ncbi:MAG: PP2C family protein-serine/threonine phosphatase [Bacteriovoracales bacterium]|jgi:PPM family protein phosphatase
MIKLKSYSANTNQGPFLQVNEDDIDVDLVNKLFLIFDGYGGSGIGDKSCQSLKRDLKAFYTKFAEDPDSTMPFFFSPKYNLEGNALINSLHSAHKSLKDENLKKEYALRGGASIIAGALSEQLLTMVSIGNCLSLLYRKNHLEIITKPDSLATLTQDKFKAHLQTTPLSGLGLFEDLYMNIKELKILEGDLIIFLTDGAYSRINNEELRYIIEAIDLSLPKKVEEVFKLSNSRGNLDNQSCVFLQF